MAPSSHTSFKIRDYSTILIAFFAQCSHVFALNNCPVLGPLYPQPTGLQNDPAFQAAASNLTQQLQHITQTGDSPWGPIAVNDTSFASGVFSLDSPDLLFEFNWTSPGVTLAPGSKPTIDSHTRVPIGSLTKVFTVYTVLSEIGDGCWTDPITKYVPELEQVAAHASADPINSIQWHEVTLGDFASQLVDGPQLALAQACANRNSCTREEFFKGFIQAAPVEAAGSTAMYSDDDFQVLAYALENITGKAYPDMLKQNILRQLDLSATSWERPADSESLVTPAVDLTVAVGQSTGYDTPSGGMFSSVSDLAKFGRSILNSTILPPALTRRWLQPRSHTTDLRHPVGAPWEITRTELHGRTVDLYTKGGDAITTSNLLVLVPDLNVGIVNTATKNPDNAHALQQAVPISGFLTNQIAATMLPAIDDAARNQAAAAYAGHYAGGNSTLSLAVTDPDFPGLNVTRATLNGADVFAPLFGDGAAVVSLQATGLRSGSDIAFRALGQSYTPLPAPNIVATLDCDNWLQINQPGDANQLVFTLGADGQATKVSGRAFEGQVLERVG